MRGARLGVCKPGNDATRVLRCLGGVAANGDDTGGTRVRARHETSTLIPLEP